MKVRPIVQIVLAVVIVGLGFLLFKNIKKDIDFDSEYNARRDACAERLKVIRTLEEAYKQTYNVYCGNFDTLITRLMTEDSLLIPKEDFDTAAILKAVENGTLLKDYEGEKTFAAAIKEVQNMTDEEQIEAKYVIVKPKYVKALDEMRAKKDYKDLIVKDPKNGVDRPITDQEIRDCRYVPGFGKDKEFHLVAKEVDGVPVFLAWVDFEELYVGDKIDPVLLKNLIADNNNKSKILIEKMKDPIYNCWRVGDTLKPETRGNFE